jgi:hypothetical protein
MESGGNDGCVEPNSPLSLRGIHIRNPFQIPDDHVPIFRGREDVFRVPRPTCHAFQLLQISYKKRAYSTLVTALTWPSSHLIAFLVSKSQIDADPSLRAAATNLPEGSKRENSAPEKREV